MEEFQFKKNFSKHNFNCFNGSKAKELMPKRLKFQNYDNPLKFGLEH